jgi:hypothetical protein
MPVQAPIAKSKANWIVHLHLAHVATERTRTGKNASMLEKFGVAASGYDEAKRNARAWLEAKGCYKVRAINMRADAVRELVAYVEKT